MSGYNHHSSFLLSVVSGVSCFVRYVCSNIHLWSCGVQDSEHQFALRICNFCLGKQSPGYWGLGQSGPMVQLSGAQMSIFKSRQLSPRAQMAIFLGRQLGLWPWTVGPWTIGLRIIGPQKRIIPNDRYVIDDITLMMPNIY